MTKHLHDVLSDIASDAASVDLLDRVRSETRALRWRRRAAVGGVALGAAGAIVLGAVLIEPVVDAPTDPAETAAPVSPLPAEIDLTTATPGGVEAASLVMVSGGVLYAVDAATDDVVRIETGQPVTGYPELSADGSRVLLQFNPMTPPASPMVEVIDLATGATLLSEAQQRLSLADRFGLAPDGQSLAAARYETDSLGNAVGPPRLEMIDFGSGDATLIAYAPLADRRADLEPLGGLAWSPDGTRLTLSYLNGQDIIEMPSGIVVSTETVSSKTLTGTPWSPDSSRLLMVSTSSVSTWPADPAAAGAQPIGSSPIIGIPLGFAGADLLLWDMGGGELVVTTLDGEPVGVPTRVVSDTPVDYVASAVATAPG